MNIETEIAAIGSCPNRLALAARETINIIEGKWKLPIIGHLLFGNKRFGQLQKEIRGITPRMLSKELKDLELNGIVVRNEIQTRPLQVEYELTDSGATFREVLVKMIEWGLQHRENSIGKG